MATLASESIEQDQSTSDARTAGVGRLTVEHVAGRSRVVAAYATNPLKLLTPTPPMGDEPAPPRVFVSGYGGGLLSGDRVELDVSIGEGASGMLGTQASTKAYHADPSGTPATQRLDARVARDGRLALLPDPVVCFADAVYEQEQAIDVAADGGAVVLDWMTAGRVGSGERWAFSRYLSRTRVRLDGREIVHDALMLDHSTPGGVGPFARGASVSVLATLWFVGSAAAEGAAWVERLRGEPVERDAAVIASGGVLADGEAVVGRWAGGSVESVRAALDPALDGLRRSWRIDPWSRKW
ncbi:MAG: urease accessory protein UreD [Planctomycetota bacterium]